jgi:SAM-dependent methyltransferase
VPEGRRFSTSKSRRRSQSQPAPEGQAFLATGRWTIKRPIADFLRRLGLLAPVFRLYESLLAREWRSATGEVVADGLPVPPKELRVRAGPRAADVGFFLETGARDLEMIVDALRRDGAEVGQLRAVLDFGCGCGRVLRNWQDRRGPAIHGCDLSQEQIDWCRRNLTFAQFTRNELKPPLAYPGETFDLVYAFSVFTHLPEELQLDWMDELFRVLRPGGYLLISTHGEPYLDRLTNAERERFASGLQVVLYEEGAGTGLCSTYTPAGYVERVLGKDFRYVSFMPTAASGQDAHLMQKAS